MRRILLAALFLLCAVPAFAVPRTRYVSTSGSDAATGEDSDHPWKHVTNMQDCTGNCASFVPTSDDVFILKGGDTWTYDGLHGGLPWLPLFNGTSGHPVTVGSGDHTWFTGVAWTRPKWDFEYLGNQVLSLLNNHDLIFDSIEISHMTADSPDNQGLVRIFTSQRITFNNCYLHGWRLTGSGQRPDGAHGGIILVNYSAIADTQTINFTNGIIENSENSAPASSYIQNGLAVRQIGTISGTEIYGVSSAILFAQDIDGNYIHDMGGSNNQSTDWSAALPYHTNITYSDPSAQGSSTTYIRNNVFVNALSGTSPIFPNPTYGSTVVAYDNVVRGALGDHSCVTIDTFSGDVGMGGTIFLANNVCDLSDAGTSTSIGIHVSYNPSSPGYRPPMAAFTSRNNQFIYKDGGSVTEDDTSEGTGSGQTLTAPVRSNNLNQALATASAQGYFAANNYAPSNGTGGTVDAGFDLSGTFTTDINGVTRVAPWDIGAYQWVGGTNYYVATTGNDGNLGTIGSPFLTIGKCAGGAASVAVAGDTCNIRTGTYNGSVGCTFAATGCPVGTSFANAVTIKAYNNEVVTLTRTGGGVDSIFGMSVGALYPAHRDAFWILEGLIFDGTNTVQFPIAGLFMDHVRMVDCDVKNAKNSGGLPEGNNWEFLNTNFHDNGTDAQDHGLYWSGSGVLVDGGRFYNNQGLGIQQLNSTGCDGTTDQGKECTNDNTYRNTRIYTNGLSPGGGGLFMGTGSNNFSYNNLIYNNTGPGESIDSRCGLFTVGSSPGTPCQSLNDTVYGNSSYGIAIGATDSNVIAPVVRNAILYMNGTAILNQSYMNSAVLSNNLIDTNPSFTDASMADFTIPAGSAARAYGLNLTYLGISALDMDFAGNARPAVAAWDAGAYQYVNPICMPDHLSFSAQPSSAVVGATLGTVSVKILDISDVWCTDATNTVSLAPSGVATYASLTSSSNLSKVASGGIATWTDLFVSPTAGSGTILAASSGLTGATSNSITISAPVIAGTGNGIRARIRAR